MQLKNKINLCLLILFLTFFSTSCYSDYTHLKYDTHYGAVYNTQNSREIAFIASTSAYQPPAGISRFPDGGTPKYLFEKVFLYILDTDSHKITRILNLNDLAGLIGTSKGGWKNKIIFNGSYIYYYISPVTDWSLHKKWKENSLSPEKMQAIQDKYETYYKVNVSTGETTKIDSTTFQKMFNSFYKKTKVSLTPLNKELKKTRLSEFDFILENIDNKGNDQYIEETIYLKNGSPVTRRAVVEQIIAKKSKEEILALLEKMDQYKNSLTGSEKIQYEIFSEDTYSAIRSLVEDNCKTMAEKAFKLWKAEKYIESDKLYLQAIDCDPEDPEIWNAYGEMNYKAGSLNAADTGFTEALKLDPSFAPAWKNFGIMAIDNEDFTRALECLEKAHKFNPADESITALLDKLKYELGVVTEQDP
ncbi:MAG: hypothetical protein PVG39_09215 [Desulfobacteraceae bacterium]|jgi:tetratricopeptide (TPR) repeat protein